jgi:hypothetical protein
MRIVPVVVFMVVASCGGSPAVTEPAQSPPPPAKADGVGIAPAPGCPTSCTGRAPSELVQALQARMIEAKSCYERALHDDPNIGGKLKLSIRIVNSGAVCNVEVESAEIHERSTTSCSSVAYGRSYAGATRRPKGIASISTCPFGSSRGPRARETPVHRSPYGHGGLRLSASWTLRLGGRRGSVTARLVKIRGRACYPSRPSCKAARASVWVLPSHRGNRGANPMRSATTA